MIQLYNDDCFEQFDKLISNGVKVDAIIADPPYQKTNCKWDRIIPITAMWDRLNRIIKPNGVIILTAIQPYTSSLIMKNLKMFRYTLVYEKTSPTGHLNAKKMPLRAHEDIVVFYSKLPTYNPQKTFNHKRKVSKANRNKLQSDIYGNESGTTYYDSTERYPRSVIKFSSDKQRSNLHPTQKPVKLLEWLIKTYTNQGETVLDFCMGSGSTGVACINTMRNFIGIEIDTSMFDVAKRRLSK
jgi:DNA modification methylase